MRETHDKQVARWLFTIAGMIFVMAVIGAITRLTESGLSIMEWAPFSGALPPFSSDEWQRLFDLYRQIPEYQTQNLGMTLEEFKEIFWWEWIHRFWGRLIGIAFALPFFYFLLRRRLPRWIVPHLIAALVLGGLQGALGWFMVASGFAQRDDVSQYRLVAHLTLALALYAYVLWLGLKLTYQGATPGLPQLRRPLVIFLCLLIVTMASGGFVAGLNAGLIYNSYPLMDGQLVPSGYAPAPLLQSFFEDVTTVQFNHRALTLLTFIMGLWVGLKGLAVASGPCRRAFGFLIVMLLAQMTLGIATLILAVPVALGALHQAGAILLLTASLIALYHARARP